MVWIGLGANVGPARSTLARACALLDEGPLRLLEVSALYASRPMGPADQPDFLNAAACLASSVGLRTLLDRVKAVELRLGRLPRQRWREREVDVDLLLAAEDGPCAAQAESPGLRLPHPGLWERSFVIAPLLDLAATMDRDLVKELTQAGCRLEADAPGAVWRVEEAGWFRNS